MAGREARDAQPRSDGHSMIADPSWTPSGNLAPREHHRLSREHEQMSGRHADALDELSQRIATVERGLIHLRELVDLLGEGRS